MVFLLILLLLIRLEKMLVYKKGSLFDAPKGSILVHACNAQGVWGSGIAKEFKERFPKSFEEYNRFCDILEPKYANGRGFICSKENSYNVGCLITSENYGSLVDSPDIILYNTASALEDLFINNNFKEYHSNKFNSGLFNVPWEDTEALLKKLCDNWKIDWYIWEQ